jgi:hypothetical protein
MRSRGGPAAVRHETVEVAAAVPRSEYAAGCPRPRRGAVGQAEPQACSGNTRLSQKPPAQIRYAERDDEVALRKLAGLLGGLMDPRSRPQ